MQEIVPLIMSGGDPASVETLPNWARVPWLEVYRTGSLYLSKWPSPRVLATHFHYSMMPPRFFEVKPKSSKRQAYRVIEEFPDSSEEDCASGSSDEEWLPVQTGASREEVSSSDSEGEGSGNVAEGVEVEEGDEADEGDGAVEPEGPPPPRAQGKKAKEKSVRNVWKAKDNQFEGDLPLFLGESKMNVEGADPIDFFMHLFTQDIIDDIVYNTNLYAVQKGKDKLALTSEEFKTFLGINMVMSYVRYPRSRMYWSSETGLHLELIADAMPVNRCEQILSYMHFVDNYSLDPENADRFVKIRPVLDALKETFRSALDPEEFQSVDEMMIPYKGRLSIKQYVPKKPKPWGIKVWLRAGSSGCMYNFEPYQGPAGGRGEISQLGMAGDVVMRLCEDIQDKNHKALEHQGIYGTGSCRSNRLHGAQEKLKREKQIKQEGRGSVSVVTNARNITVTRWLDSSVIHMASSCTGLSPTDVAQRWSKKEKQMLNIQRPFSVIYVMRNPRDVFTSSFHFHSMASFLVKPGPQSEFLHKFLDGKVMYGSWFDHVKGWLNAEDKDHIMYIAYEEMIMDLKDSVSRLAQFLEKPLDSEVIEKIAERCLFKNMKQNNMSNYSTVPQEFMDQSKSEFLRKVQTQQTDSINSQNPVSWYQFFTAGCRRVWDHCSDEDAFHSAGSVLEWVKGSMMCGVLGGVRRHGGSRGDLLTSLLIVSWICTSRCLSFWDKRTALQELNSSKQWVERGQWREGGDGGKGGCDLRDELFEPIELVLQTCICYWSSHLELVPPCWEHQRVCDSSMRISHQFYELLRHPELMESTCVCRGMLGCTGPGGGSAVPDSVCEQHPGLVQDLHNLLDLCRDLQSIGARETRSLLSHLLFWILPEGVAVQESSDDLPYDDIFVLWVIVQSKAVALGDRILEKKQVPLSQSNDITRTKLHFLFQDFTIPCDHGTLTGTEHSQTVVTTAMEAAMSLKDIRGKQEDVGL
ncbi:hypothetical protein INR49_000928 [Caranx melampygus]|nr:hypothetical protein INR49_000928 [Caranx melampygus]